MLMVVHGVAVCVMLCISGDDDRLAPYTTRRSPSLHNRVMRWQSAEAVELCRPALESTGAVLSAQHASGREAYTCGRPPLKDSICWI